MNNVLLGKTIKAMYKQSGKTLNQLAEETDLTVDTINNLFYARIQKPSLAGVCTLVKAMGFTPSVLIGFMEENESLPESTDVTEKFISYISSAGSAVPSASPAKPSAAGTKKEGTAGYPDQVLLVQKEQIEQLKQTAKEQSERYEKRLAEFNELHLRENDWLKQELEAVKKSAKRFSLSLIALSALLAVIVLLDLLNRGVGWFR